MSKRKIPVDKEISDSIGITIESQPNDSQESNNFNDDEKFLIEIYLESITDKVTKPLLINKIQIKYKTNILRKKKLEKGKINKKNNLIDYWISSNIFAYENINKLLAKLKIDKYKYKKEYFLKAFPDCEYPLLDEYEINKIKNFDSNPENIIKISYIILQDQRNSQNDNNISIINNEALIISLKEIFEFTDPYENLIEFWNIYGQPYIKSLINKRFEFSDPYEDLIELWNIYGQPYINSFINNKFEFSDPYDLLVVGNLFKDIYENQFSKNMDEFGDTRINSNSEDGFEIAEQNKNTFGESKNLFELEEQYMNSFVKDVNEFSDNNIEINRDYYDT